MHKLSIPKLGLAAGSTAALFYLGCAILMILIGRDATIVFFNSLLHGLNTEPIIRMNVPLWEAAIGIVEMFILGWFAGALIGAIYNFQYSAAVNTGKNAGYVRTSGNTRQSVDGSNE